MQFIIVITVSSGYVCVLSFIHALTRLVEAGPVGTTHAKGVPGARFVSPILGIWAMLMTIFIGKSVLDMVFLFLRHTS